MNLYFGGGLTVFALIAERPNDSFGAGIAWSRLNPHGFSKYSELMLQSYYQGQIYLSSYFQIVLSYIPIVGNNPEKSQVFALTGRIMVLF